MGRCTTEDWDTAESYLLGELDPNRREVFEAHCFACDECFRRVELLSEQIRFLRGNLPAPAPGRTPATESWWSRARWARRLLAPPLRPAWVAGAALTAVAAVGVPYVLKLQSHLNDATSARAVTGAIVLEEAVRAPGARPVLSRRGGPVQLEFHWIAEASTTPGPLRVVIVDAAGHQSEQVQLLEPIDGFGTYALLIWPERLAAGTAKLRVTKAPGGTPSDQVRVFEFEISR